MSKKKFYIILILFIIFLILKISQLISRKSRVVEASQYLSKIENQKKYTAFVTDVINGNTLKIKYTEETPENHKTEETVFMIGTNIPSATDKEKNYFNQAKLFTNRYLSGKNIEILLSENNSSNKNGLNVFVYHEGYLFNKILIETGNALYNPNQKFDRELMNLFHQAEKYSKKNNKGRWKK